MVCYDAFAMRERMQDIGRRLGGPVAVGLILGLIGPFGTYELLSLPSRLGYWLAVVAFNWLLSDIAIRRVDAWLPLSLPLRRFAVPLIGAVLVSVPATGVVALANGLSGIGWPESIPALYWKVVLLLAAVSVPVYTFEDMRSGDEAQAADVPHGGADGPVERNETHALARFQARLPRPLESRLLCLEMQDHYLVVHTASGSDMILCRMEDAARDLSDMGQRVHRSWWVARDAVTGTERDGQRLMLRLADDRRVPVGRTYRSTLKAGGWLDV